MEIEVPEEDTPPPAPPATHPAPRMLADKHPLERDGSIQFFPESHMYIYDGKSARVSVTGLVKQNFPVFDASKIVNERYPQWKHSKTNKYSALIKYLQLVEEKDDDYCKGAIRALWDADGKKASDEGTAMHADFEAIVNGLPPPQGETKEVVLFRQWLGAFCSHYDVEPFRSEMIVYYLHMGNVLVAGQVDLVLKSKTEDKYWCVDYKRKDPTSKYAGCGPQLLGMGESATSSFGDEEGTGPFEGLAATDFYKYSAQQNIYGYIAAEQYNIDFRDRMYLLQIHPSMDTPHTVTVPRMDDRMEVLIAIERDKMEGEPSSPF